MGHLSTEQFVDAVEGVPAASASAHLEACERCRRQVADLRALMNRAAEDDVPEPSPLFWDHLSARIREAVSVQPPPARGLFGWLDARALFGAGPAPAVTVIAASLLATVVVTGVAGLRWNTDDRQSIGGKARAMADADADADPLADDPSLQLVARLAADVDWESTPSVALVTVAGGADAAVAQLTANERRELGRLLNEAMGKPGS
jgi:hypothetical protein